MAPPEVETQWYEALFEEDCPRIMQLLKDHPELLKQGWECEPTRTVEGSRQNFWMPRTRSAWKGRSALHVGARRGCLELIQQVLEYCHVGDVGLDRNLRFDLHGCETHSDLVRKLLASEASRQRVRKARQAARKTSSSAATVDIAKLEATASDVWDLNGDTDMLQLADLHWKRQVDGRTACRSRSACATERELEEDSDLVERQESADVSVSLEDLLYLKDGEYQLDAVAIAALHANLDILCLLLIRKSRSHIDKPRGFMRNNNGTEDQKAQIRTITEEVIASLLGDPALRTSCQTILEAYSKHRDFNFLPRNEYLFHFLFAKNFFRERKDSPSLLAKLRLIRVYIWEEVRGSKSTSLWRFLLKLQDGQGRTPGHVAVDEGTIGALGELLEGDTEEEAYMCAITASDAAGRTVLHRAVALGRMDAIKSMRSMLSENQQFENMLKTRWQHSLGDVQLSKRDSRLDRQVDIDGVSRRNGFGGCRISVRNLIPGQAVNYYSPCTPLHSAIIHKRTDVLKKLDEFVKISNTDPPFHWISDVRISDYECMEELDNMELASLVGEVGTVRRLLEEGFQQQPWSLETECYNPRHLKYLWPKGKHRWPALLLAANSGNYELLKCFIDSPRCDAYIVDSQGDTALHHALTSIEIEFKTHLLDYVNCEHISSRDPRKAEEKAKERDRHSLVERQGCINLLLQAGCDIFLPNKEGQVPYPRGSLRANNDFLLWWDEKQGKEFKMIQSTLSYFANAISVTATLVATASYLGPLQPPGGYVGSPGQILVDNIWVRIFIVCDTLSFYLAIAAIIFSLIPSLPMPQQWNVDELRRTRAMVTLAVAILFPSIICVFLAFASSSIEVISANAISSVGGTLMMSTASVGGFICLGGFFLFFIRFLGFVFPKHTFVRYIYNAISF